MTLLEVVISVALFSIIAASLMRMTNTTIQYRKKITKNISDIQYQRNSLQILKKDLRNVFLAQDINAKLHSLLIQRIQQKNTPSTINMSHPVTDNNPYFHNKNRLFGGLKGSENSLHISSFSHTRTQKDEKAGDQSLVSYYLKSCKSRWDMESNIESCLWRKVSRYPEQNIEALDTDEEYVLLESVKTFNISYFNIFNNQWLNRWSSSPNAQNSLPAYIKVTIEFEDSNRRLIKQELSVPVYQQQIPLKLVAG